MSYDHVIRDLYIYKAALNDDWDSVSGIFDHDPDLLTKQITWWHETPLHIAVGTGHSHRFVENLVKRIVAMGAKDKLFQKNSLGRHPLHYAAITGNTTAARLLVEHGPEMTQDPTGLSHLPHENLVKRVVSVGGKKKLFPTNSLGGDPLRYADKLVQTNILGGDPLRYADNLIQTNSLGGDPLRYTAVAENTTTARQLAEQVPEMTQDPNGEVNRPLYLAALCGNKETLKYLLTVTPDIPPEEGGISQYTGVVGGDLITRTIMNGFYDVALDIMDTHPNIVLEHDRTGKTALDILALKPENYLSGSTLGFWGSIIYSLMPIKMRDTYKDTRVSRKSNKLFYFQEFTAGFWSALQFMAPSIKNIHDIKVKNHLTSLLIERICNTVIQRADHDIALNILGSAMATSVKYGIHELTEKCILTYPGLIWLRIAGGFYLFTTAVEQRQETVYNLIYQVSRFRVWTTQELSKKQENILHIAAKLAPPQRLNVVTGAALQMQRELQWFQEIENLVQPSYKEALNKKEETPRMVFTKEHKELLVEGRDWMKDTSSSCTVVAALIVTMAFAAAFTVPGGNQDDGNPLFLNYDVFMLFIVSDCVALFSSATSVLMFLGILTSRYAEVDFLYALPKRLAIGLLSLFMSLVATMIAFSSAITLALKDKVTWIAAPLIIATCIPVCLFGLLQFPLLVELVKSTYGKSIFRKQSSRMIH